MRYETYVEIVHIHFINFNYSGKNHIFVSKAQKCFNKKCSPNVHFTIVLLTTFLIWTVKRFWAVIHYIVRELPRVSIMLYGKNQSAEPHF